MRKIIFIVSFLTLFFSVKAQFDTTHVHLTKNQFTVYPMMELAYLELKFKDNNFERGIYSTTLTSRYTTSVGFGMSFYRFGFSFSFQLPYSDIDELKNSKAFNFAGGYSYKRFYGELRYRDYKGFQKADLIHDSIKGDVHVRKDIELKQVGLAMNYFFSRKFNFDANFKNYNIQKKSAASFLVLAGTNFYRIKGSYLIADTNHVASDITYVKDLDVYAIKVAPGGAFSLTYKGLYWSTLLAVGAAFNRNILKGDTRKNIVYQWTPVVEGRSAIGYNSQKWFASLTLNIESDYFFSSEVNLSVMNVFYNLKVGYKFNSKYLGKLEKYL